MADLKIEVIQIKEILPHPDPETTALELAVVNGWQTVIKKGSLQAGDWCIYFPIDSVLPVQLSDKINVTNYLSKGRVKSVRLRGEPSYGLLWPFKLASKHYPGIEIEWQEKEDLSEFLGVTKWEPPLKLNAQDAMREHGLFFKYTNIDNYRNYPNILNEGEEVVMTEKIHGTNSRHGFIEEEFMAGSHNLRLKENENNRYWYVFDDKMKDMLKSISEMNGNANVIMYGEIYGSGVQDLKYGMNKGLIKYRCFDISVNGEYIDFENYYKVCTGFGIDMVPLLYRGKFSFDKIKEFSTNKSVISDDTIMEGVVIKPVKERNNMKIGRVVLKYVFDQYLLRKKGTEYK